MIEGLRAMLDTWIGRFRSVPVLPDIETTSDEEKKGIAEEKERTRRELAHLQLRALRLATERRSQQGEIAE